MVVQRVSRDNASTKKLTVWCLGLPTKRASEGRLRLHIELIRELD
jgi:hypothetical protein